jgi:hypothetical protein
VSVPVEIISESRYIKWENGLPVPATRPIFNNDSAKNLAICALSLPYEGVDPLGFGVKLIEPEFEGMTNGEVAYIRLARLAAAGSMDALDKLMDRAIGKPRQEIDSTVNVTAGFQLILERPNQNQETIVDVSPSTK